jgi:transposase InsO family protein
MERLYYWPRMQKTCDEVFLRCHTCQKVKRPPSKAKDNEQFVPISKPMAVVAIDIVGPLGNSKSATSDKNRFICTMIDWFTRFVVCFAIKDTTAETIGDCIAKFTKQFGTPLTIISDNAQYFTDQALGAYETMMGIKHSFVAAFRPEGNGMLERFHGNIARSLKVRAADARSNNWDLELDSIAFAYNISTHGVTGYTPFYLMHGWDPVLPFDVSIPPLDNEYAGYHDWVEAAAKRQRCAHDEAYSRMTVSQIDRVKKSNPSNKPLKTGDSVYLWVPSVPRQAIKKITMRWHGPYKVTSARVGRKCEIVTKRGKL